MAEPSIEETKTLASIFTDGYNKVNGTDFVWDNERSYQPKEPFDFILYSHQKELGVQIVRAVGDGDKEYARPKRCDKVVDKLRKRLEENNFVPSISVYLNFFNPPKDDEIEDAVYWLEFFISEKAVNGWRKGYFSYDESFDGEYLKQITKWVNDIDIAPLELQKKHIRFIYGYSKREVEPLVSDDVRVVNAVNKKARLYTDVILLVDSGTMPIFDFYIPVIRNSLASSKFEEIWVVNNFITQRKAERVR